MATAAERVQFGRKLFAVVRVLIRRRGAIIIQQYPPGGRFQIVKLATANSPEKGGNCGDQKNQSKRNKCVNYVQAGISSPGCVAWLARVEPAAAGAAGAMTPSRRAFSMTRSELNDMPSAAIQGTMRPLIANGIASAL